MAINNLIAQGIAPIGRDLPDVANMLAQRRMQEQQNAIAAQNAEQYRRSLDMQSQAREQEMAQRKAAEARGWIEANYDAIKARPDAMPKLLALAKQKQYLPPDFPDNATLEDVALHFGVQAPAAPVPFEQTPDGMKFNEQRRQFDERMKLDRAKFAADQRAGAAAPGAQAVAAPAEPLPVGALRMVDDAKQAINATGESLTIVDRAIQKIENGEVNLGMASNAKARVRNTLGVSTKESRAFADIKQTLEKLRNNYLLLAKGVQTEGDAQRAWNSEIGESVQNDNKLAAQQLGKAKMLLQRAIQAQNDRISGVYANYGASPPAAPAAADGWSIVEVK